MSEDLNKSIAVAGAPVSFGAFEVTVGVDPNVPEAITVLDAVARAGYAGIDLGPPGYLGAGGELTRRLRDRALGLAGGYIAMPFSEPDRMAPAMDELGRLLDTLEMVKADAPVAPRPTLADAGSDARRRTPGRAHDDPSLMLDAAAWSRFAESMKRVTALCRQRGLEPTFHHHGASYVETPEEVEELLERTDVGLCLDIGHLVIGGGDPVTAARDWARRINHLHLKDVRRDVVARVIAAEGTMIDFWRERAFCPLGEGDLDIDGVLDALGAISLPRSAGPSAHASGALVPSERLRRSGRVGVGAFSGWLVVEQDMLPRAGEPPDRAATDQERNREFLRARGL